jgi:hypothetical protein
VWPNIGDASCTVAPNGDLMLARNFTSQPGELALLDPTSFTWTVLTPLGKNGGNSEENWTLLPDGSIFTVDVGRAAPGAGRFLPPWLNGLSQGNNYGDDEAAATNYPLVRITNHVSCRVFYARTHDHSTMAVATGSAIVSTNFDVPTEIDPGPSDLVVVTNGIPSQPVRVIANGPPGSPEPLGPPPAGCTPGQG